MYQALYRKYRPQVFEDVCGQEQTVAVLKNQIKSGKVSHAYLFCGSRGTGKTTCAKILAKAVNCEDLQNGDPCGKCFSCQLVNDAATLDVVEIDAAGNNGVDSIRQLCDEVKYMPSELKKRVYIIDEVHMLTTAAFNALLKTLEEPPEHVLFILATTEIQKIPATIVSRCQRLNFNRIKPEVIVDRIMHISSAEGIQIEREAAAVIARLSDGALRDALSILESCIGKVSVITEEEITKMLGMGSRDMLFDICRACAQGNAPRCISLLGELYDKQSDMKSSISSLFGIYKDLLLIKNVPSPKSFIECSESDLDKLISIAEGFGTDTILYHIDILQKLMTDYDRISSGKRAFIEVSFIKMCCPEIASEDSALSARIDMLEAMLKNGNINIAKKDAPAEKKKEKAKQEPINNDIPVTDEFSGLDIPDDLGENAYGDITDNYDTSEDIGKAVNEPDKTDKKETRSKVSTENAEISSGSRSRIYAGKSALVERFENDPFLQMYLGEAKMYISGDELTVYTERFTCDLLKSMGAENTLTEELSKVDPSVKKVKFAADEEEAEKDILDTL